MLITTAEDAATAILDGVARGRGRVLIGRDARGADAIARLVPALAPRIGAWLGSRTPS
ncbi:hypothetical protein [Arsenicicoccus sp. oral taxon 190]|uniref:hypothetical protein n=1 Tax=Arsenicicoccus sp. oral taxon 190 TaxID=1658671 RepID=UPI001C1292BD|nr:hypothetical protein [Arsenicicoccus sp. oral taxon 190]